MPAGVALGRVLVVDDDEGSREMLAQRLERADIVVQTAMSGREALDRLTNTEFDLVLLDRSMPRMSGMEVLKEIRSRTSLEGLPVIMVTAEAHGHAVLEALAAGANDYVTKPVDFPVVLARVKAHLERFQMQRKLRQSERRYALAAEAANDVVMDWSLASGEVYLSPRWSRMLGLRETAHERSIQDWFERVHPLDLVRLHAAIDECVAVHRKQEEANLEIEYRLRHQDGSYRWVRNRCRAVTEPGDPETHITGSLTDITASKFADPLTGLANRTYLLERLTVALERSKRTGAPLAVLFLDLDGFKYVNDSLGHTAGDELLVVVANCLRQGLAAGGGARQEAPVVARLGGDEFAVIVEDGGSGADEATRILAGFSEPFPIGENSVYVTVSLGIANYQPRYTSPHELLRDADTAMYFAKASGKNRAITFTAEMHHQALRRLQLSNYLRDSVANNDFTLAFQPIVSLADGGLMGFEALLRWPPGHCSTQELIGIAEETGMIVQVDRWVLRESCRRMRLLQDAPGWTDGLSLHVNASGVQFATGEFPELVRAVLAETGLAPGILVIEITETSMMKDGEGALRSLQALREMGVRLSIDDFGTGYSSLSYLHQFPFDTLKLDRSFLRNKREGCENFEIVKAVVQLAHALRIKVVAEGVETANDAEQVARMGCEFGQGYHFCRPLDWEAVLVYLEHRSPAAVWGAQ